jgi:hypothetical protein
MLVRVVATRLTPTPEPDRVMSLLWMSRAPLASLVTMPLPFAAGVIVLPEIAPVSMPRVSTPAIVWLSSSLLLMFSAVPVVASERTP